ncbi:cation:proton antiporter [soil metagenome]
MNLIQSFPDLAWPATLLIAWLAGELCYHRFGLPRISIYALVGFVLAFSQIGLLPQTSSNTILLLANTAFALILFEAGYGINLHWLRVNPWIGLTSLFETILTFTAVFLLARWFNLTFVTASLLATLAMATSPATIMRVVNEYQGSGQVTERALHLSVLNCVLAVLIFKIIVGLAIFKTTGNFAAAIYDSVIVVSVSIILGALFGMTLPILLRTIQRTPQDSTLAFTIAVIVLVAITHGLNLSPVLAALTFGLLTRHRRIILSPWQRGFGALGDLLSILLFVFIASTLEWHKIIAGIGIGIALIVVRSLTKIIGITSFSHLSGITWRKGLLISLAMTPLSAFVILVLEQSRSLGINFIDQLQPVTAAALILEIVGPIVTLYALRWAKEVPNSKELKNVTQTI